MRERVLFMGTPQFAVPTLKRLIAEYEVAGVVTQPDRPAGRGRHPTLPPVKDVALAHNLPLFQPPSLNRPEVLAQIQEWQPQVVVLVAFGLLLPQAVLQATPFGCLNIHPSLLPKYRGASPIHAAILAGERKTGVTIIRMDAGLDTGPILAQAEEPIFAEDTAHSLSERLAELGAELLAATLPQWFARRIEPRPQNNALASYTKELRKEDGLIDWKKSAEEIARQVRAYYPWPSGYTTWRGSTLKVISASPQDESPQGEPGQVISAGEGAAVISGDGLLVLNRLQLAGKREMEIVEFLRGYRNFIGSRLG